MTLIIVAFFGGAELMGYSLPIYGLALFCVILARYFICAGGMHLLLDRVSGIYANKNCEDKKANISLSSPAILQDIKLSILSSVVFAMGAIVIRIADEAGITLLYTDIHQYSAWYLVASYCTVIILQDTYFYFLHRLLHHRYLFKWSHQGHHRSRQPTPWTSFAFDLPESIAHLFFTVVVIFIVPLHFVTIIAVLSTMTVWAVVNHLGIEQLPKNFPHHWCGRWFTGPAHHAIHHQQYAMHFGLYFTFWDKLLGTETSYFEKEISNVTN